MAVVNPLRIDPTQTESIKRSFAVEIKKKFAALRRSVFTFVVTDDAFGLNRKDVLMMNAGEFRFLTDPDKINAFKRWFRKQVRDGVLLAPEDGDPEAPWTSKYIGSAYRKAQYKTFLKETGEPPPMPSYIGGARGFLRDAFDTGSSTAQIKLLATRAYNQLEGVSNAMSSRMADILARGFASGKNAREIGTELSDAISKLSEQRAQLIARTEIANAYAEAQLDAFVDLGIDSVTVQAEFLTAGDDRVCPKCAALEGKVYKIKDARGVIPVHPQCRCAWLSFYGDTKATASKKPKAAKAKVKPKTSRASNVNKPVAKTKATIAGARVASRLKAERKKVKQ